MNQVGVTGRVAVLALAQVALDDVLEARLEQEAPRQAVEQRREPRDRGSEHRSLRPHDPPGLGERGQAVLALGQVVQGTEEQDRVEGRRLGAEPARVADLGRDAAGPRPRRLQDPGDLDGYGVDHVDPMPVLGQPLRVHTGRAADVEDAQRPGRQVAAHDLTRTQQLELAEPVSDALAFIDLVAVVPDDLLGRPMLTHPASSCGLAHQIARASSRAPAGAARRAVGQHPSVRPPERHLAAGVPAHRVTHLAQQPVTVAAHRVQVVQVGLPAPRPPDDVVSLQPPRVAAGSAAAMTNTCSRSYGN